MLYDNFLIPILILRNVLRQGQPLRIPLSRPRARRTRRPPTPPNLLLQLQKRRKAIRVLQRHKREAPLLCARDRVPTYGGRGTGKGHMGVQLSDTARDEQQHQDGRRHRGLSTHRIRIFEEQVSSERCHRRKDILPARQVED